ncbi:MAG: hypothetical protein ACRYFU_12800 [Janthinobacterium lividum]
MKRFAGPVFTILLLLSVMIAVEPRAFAYVDPGSGLVIYQAVGALATAGIFWFRRRLKSLFRRDANTERPGKSGSFPHYGG